MVPDVQSRAARRDDRLLDLAPLLPGANGTGPECTVDVPLHWQQWDLRSRTLDGIAAAVIAHASRELGPMGRAPATRS